MLSKLGVKNLTVYDGDNVESQNVPIAAYGRGEVGLSKPAALGQKLLAETGVTLVPIGRMYAGEPLRGAVVACVDTMKARQKIWEAVKGNSSIDLLIDTRVEKELVIVYAIRPDDPEDIAYYEPFLGYDDKGVAEQHCGLHGLPHVAASAAIAVCSNLTNWWMHGRKRRLFTLLVRELQVIDEMKKTKPGGK